jgi:hypothetical protein
MRLVRRLVAAESRVPVDAEQRQLRLGDQLGRERSQVHGQTLEQRHHRRAHVLLVVVLARLKPFASVVSFQRAKK